jgi:limonene-1,2-epoxide hydrolase
MTKIFAVCLISLQSNLMGLDVETFFNSSNKSNLKENVQAFYTEDIHFVDPVGEVRGVDAMLTYYEHLYANLISIRFDFDKRVQSDEAELMIPWTMYARHKRIKSGEEIRVDGVSHIKFRDGKAYFHRDYFDLGQMLYEHLPIIGGLTRWIKKKAKPD